MRHRNQHRHRKKPASTMSLLNTLVLLLLLLINDASTSATSSSAPPPKPNPNRLFLIDCDNTLYRQTSIESQIVSNIHQYCLEHYQISASKADSLHRSYGSTIEGLSDPATFNLSLSQTSDFYRSVYSSIDYHSLLPVNSQRQSLTGYSAHSSRNSNYRYPWLPLLVSLSKLEVRSSRGANATS